MAAAIPSRSGVLPVILSREGNEPFIVGCFGLLTWVWTCSREDASLFLRPLPSETCIPNVTSHNSPRQLGPSLKLLRGSIELR